MAKSSFTLIGLGPVGRTVALALSKSGWTPSLLVGRDRISDRQFARKLRTPFALSLDEINQTSGLIIIAVPTRSVKLIAQDLATQNLPWTKLTVLHCAGPIGSDVLKPIAALGAGIVAAHPYQTFPRITTKDHTTRLAGILWGISGNKKGIAAATAMVKSLAGISVTIPEKKRFPYHASAVMACSQTISNLAMSIQVLCSVGVNEHKALAAVLSMAKETIRNISELGIKDAWSGPAVRGDLTLIKKQTKTLYPIDPITSQTYGLVSRWVMEQFGTTPPKRPRRKIVKKGQK